MCCGGSSRFARKCEDYLCQTLALGLILFCHCNVSYLLECDGKLYEECPDFVAFIPRLPLFSLYSVFYRAIGSLIIPGPQSSSLYYGQNVWWQFWFQIFLWQVYFYYFRASMSNPGKIKSRHEVGSQRFLLNSSRPKKFFCQKCQVPKAARTHHCRVCQCCIDRMDHHCPWIGTCVGRFNAPLFVRFLVWTSVALLLAMFLCIRQFYHWKKAEFLMMGMSRGSVTGPSSRRISSHEIMVGSLGQVILLMFTAATVFLVIVFVGIMTSSHIQYAARNLTTLEEMSISRHGRDSKRKYNNPFNLGSFKANWAAVMTGSLEVSRLKWWNLWALAGAHGLTWDDPDVELLMQWEAKQIVVSKRESPSSNYSSSSEGGGDEKNSNEMIVMPEEEPNVDNSIDDFDNREYVIERDEDNEIVLRPILGNTR